MELTKEAKEFIEYLVLRKHMRNVYGMCVVLDLKGLAKFSENTLRKNVLVEVEKIKKKQKGDLK